MNTITWHTLSEKEILKKFSTSDKGLDEKTAKKRLEKYGKNQLPRGKRASGFKILLRQFQSTLVLILLVATVVTFFLRDYIDAVVILGALVLDIVIGFVQEYRAQNAIKALRSYISEKTTVIRDQKQHQIPVEEIVPGDILVLNPGDKVAADARLIEVHNLRVSEAVLTGEPFPIAKITKTLADKDLTLGDRKNLVFRGTLVSEGSGLAVVYGTGPLSELGSIAQKIVETDDEKTPLQHKLGRFGLWLGLLVIVISAIMFFVGIALGNPPIEMFTTGVALAVSAVPEGLPL
ncbi:HAD-IC family P-type ATPase, partial [Patescibacteria group bacterium]